MTSTPFDSKFSTAWRTLSRSLVAVGRAPGAAPAAGGGSSRIGPQK